MKHLSFYVGIYDSNIGMDSISKYGIVTYMSLIYVWSLVGSTIANVTMYYLGKLLKSKDV
jgi:hypothetical protein